MPSVTLKEACKIKMNEWSQAASKFEIFRDKHKDKITSFNISNKPIITDKVYRVATTDYLAEGNSGLSQLAELPEEKVDQTGILLRDAVTQYIQKESPLKIKISGRWQKK